MKYLISVFIVATVSAGAFIYLDQHNSTQHPTGNNFHIDNTGNFTVLAWRDGKIVGRMDSCSFVKISAINGLDSFTFHSITP